MADSLEVLVEIPAFSLLADHATTSNMASEQMAVIMQKLVYQPDAADVWNLPAEQSSITGTLDFDGGVPLMRCALPLPEPGEAVLYRVTVLKTGAALDSQGKTRAEQLLPTEEELLLLVIGSAEGHQSSLEAHERLIPGIQRVVVPMPAQKLVSQ